MNYCHIGYAYISSQSAHSSSSWLISDTTDNNGLMGLRTVERALVTYFFCRVN